MNSAAELTREQKGAIIQRGADLFEAQRSTCPICGQCKSAVRVRRQLAHEFDIPELELAVLVEIGGAIYEHRRTRRIAA